MYYSTQINKLFVLRERKKPLTNYERIVNIFSKILIRINPPRFLKDKYNYLIFYNKYLLKPKDIFSAGINLFLISLIFSISFYYALSITNSGAGLEIFYGLFITGLTLSIYLLAYPFLYKKIVKITVISESVWVLAYLTIYLRENPNLENAMLFTVLNLDGYISSDFFDILYDLETKRFSSLEEAIYHYSARWKEWYPDFVYLMSLLLNVKHIQSMDRIYSYLDKIQGWYYRLAERRLKEYVSFLKPKVIIVSTFLILLPIIGMTLLPIISIFLPESAKFTLIFYVYDVLLPIISFLIISDIISEVPFSISSPYSTIKMEENKSIGIGGLKIPIFPLAFLLALFISLPSILHISNVIYNYYLFYQYSDILLSLVKQESNFGNMMITYLMIFGIGIFVGLYFYLRSFRKIGIIRKIERIEKELPMLISMIENSSYSGVPLEKSLFDITGDYKSINPKGYLAEFLEKTINNIYRFKTTIRDAIFNEKFGSIRDYPSLLLRETMNFIVSSAEKSVSSLSFVVERIYMQIDSLLSLKEELNIELSDPVSTIKVVSYILVPILGGIVMISQKFLFSAIVFMGEQIKNLFSFSPYTYNFFDFFTQQLIDINATIPPTIFIIPVGIYLIELLIISSFFLSGLVSGFNKIVRDYEIGKAVLISIMILTVIYVFGLLLIESLFSSIFMYL
ncbi:MAG: hypothetical protein BXU00_03045 [Candidatus Nanoclepta minutus]|uniref:Uncharacterized protein n=1 Tax=Candidatus Nanoclepta minutus TaxID=1940235 RepID=A0A397WM71_9ARCH|nr:MAG: hypothetical protein BXU00_03045 [Candidatus Nanoclepta minutus]